MTDATNGKGGSSMQSTSAPTPPAEANPGWFEERLGIKAFYEKFGRKAFPIHSTYFFGEMAGFCFIILVLTGIYLGIMYVPSNAEVTLDGVTVPEAYASVRLIESVPVANLFRNVHHWAAHLMIASVLLHMVRIFFTGTYRKPREINWIVGVLLLSLTLAAGFLGYSLPYDSYAVTATGVGYSIARSIPWVGETVSELIFGGNFPTLGSIPRLYTLHVFVIPALIAGAIIFHTLVIVKQKAHATRLFKEVGGTRTCARSAGVALPGDSRRTAAARDVRFALHPLDHRRGASAGSVRPSGCRHAGRSSPTGICSGSTGCLRSFRQASRSSSSAHRLSRTSSAAFSSRACSSPSSHWCRSSTAQIARQFAGSSIPNRHVSQPCA